MAARLKEEGAGETGRSQEKKGRKSERQRIEKEKKQKKESGERRLERRARLLNFVAYPKMKKEGRRMEKPKTRHKKRRDNKKRKDWKRKGKKKKQKKDLLFSCHMVLQILFYFLDHVCLFIFHYHSRKQLF